MRGSIHARMGTKTFPRERPGPTKSVLERLQSPVNVETVGPEDRLEAVETEFQIAEALLYTVEAVAVRHHTVGYGPDVILHGLHSHLELTDPGLEPVESPIELPLLGVEPLPDEVDDFCEFALGHLCSDRGGVRVEEAI
jgi:hypothetical protein